MVLYYAIFYYFFVGVQLFCKTLVRRNCVIFLLLMITYLMRRDLLNKLCGGWWAIVDQHHYYIDLNILHKIRFNTKLL